MKKNRKRIVAAFMTILMALTLVPTWLLGGVFATTAKADNTVELSGVAMATTVKDKKDKNTFGDSFGGDYDCKNGFVIDKGVIHKNSAKDIKEGSTTIFKGKKDSNGEIDSVCLQVNASNAIRYTVPEGNTATISVIAGTSGGKTGEKRNVVIKKVLGENNENEVTKGKDMTKGGSSDVNADGTAFSKTVSSKMEAGTYAIYGSNTIDIYYVKVELETAGPVTGAKPTVRPDSLKANYNTETGKIDLSWDAAVEGTGDSVYQIFVGDKKVDSVKCTEKTYSYTPDKSGKYTFTVKGALGTDVEETGASAEVTVTVPLAEPSVKATRVSTDGTKINVEASGSAEAEKYEISVYDADKKLVKTVEAEAKDGKATTTIDGLKEGYKYYVSATAVRGDEKKASDSEKMASVMPYAEKDTSQAIPGMTVINTNDADNSKTVSLTIVRENGTIKAGQTSGKSSKIEKTGIKYGSLIAAPATTKDFTFSATIKVTGAERGTSTSKQQGVYLGAFADTKQGTKDIISAELGTDGKAYSAYIGIKKDGEFDRDGGVDAKLDTEYKVTITRTGSVYTYSVKNKNDDVVMQESVTATADALKEGGAAIPAIALVGATATITNIKLTVDGKVAVDAANFTGSFNPFVDNWAIVDAPVLSDVTTEDNKKDGKITIKVDEEISPVGAAEVSVDMIDAEGKVVDTKVASSTGASVTFEPKASGDYSFKAYATRPTETTKKESKPITVKGFVLPIKAPVVNARTATDSKVEVYWDAVPEANTYKVEYKKNGDESFAVLTEGTTALSAMTPSLTAGETYIFKVTATRTSDGQSKTSNDVIFTVADHEQFVWKFSAFGQGVTINEDKLNDKKKSNNGYSGSVNTGDGSVNVWSVGSKGKLVPASTDGVAFYYATIPANKNFTLTATANVNSWTYTNGQEGFGLMAADAVGTNGDASVFWNNSYMASATKVEYYSSVDEETGVASVSKTSGDKISMKLGIGSQEKIGVTNDNIDKLKDNDTDTVTNEFKTSMSTLDTSKLGSEAGTYNLIGNYTNTDSTFVGTTVENPITTIKLTIQKNNTGYFVSYTDANGNTTTKKYYDTEALSKLDADNVYVGMFASRTCDVTYTDISLTTIDPADDAPAEERPVEYKDVVLSVSSASTSSSEDYKLKGMSNVDGHVVVTKGEEVVGEGDVKASEAFAFDTKLKVGDNKFVVTLTPDENFKFGDYELPTSYDPVEVSKSVTYAYFTGDLIYVSAEATAAVDEAKANETYSSKAQINSGKGTKGNPIDIYNAVAYAKAGQKILLLEGNYKVANNLLIPFGINGTSEKPIYMMPEQAGTRVVLDFAGTTGEGITLCGNYWYIQNIDVTNSANGKDGIHVAGSYNVLDSVNTYNNGNTGIQISRFSNVQAKSDWPAYNTIKNCTSHNNADAGYEDADGFAAKLTIGKGNVFVGCIAHNNADDGWDFFAKVETGNIPTVVIMNCVAYANGYLEDGTDAGNGNGFKMGGSSLAAGHVILNSVAFENKAKGIDSNSCPDNVVVSSTSYNNNNYNIALYTNDAKNTDYTAYGALSYRNKYQSVSDSLKAKGTQDAAKLYQATDYYWKAASGDANEASTALTDSSFVSVNTNSVNVDTATALTETATLLADTASAIKYTAEPVTRNADGTINMNGLMMLTAETRAALGAGVGADALDKAPQLTAESKQILINALGEEEFNRIASLSFASPVLSREGNEGTLTKDSSNMALMMILLMASVAAAAGVVVFEKKRRMAR
mgnify:CR=1 FL=1